MALRVLPSLLHKIENLTRSKFVMPKPTKTPTRKPAAKAKDLSPRKSVKGGAVRLGGGSLGSGGNFTIQSRDQ